MLTRNIAGIAREKTNRGPLDHGATGQGLAEMNIIERSARLVRHRNRELSRAVKTINTKFQQTIPQNLLGVVDSIILEQALQIVVRVRTVIFSPQRSQVT